MQYLMQYVFSFHCESQSRPWDTFVLDIQKPARVHCQNRFRKLPAKGVNLPGWCWAEIQQLALVGSSSSLHSEACNALGASDGVIHSSISLEVASLRAAANFTLSQRNASDIPCATLAKIVYNTWGHNENKG